MFQLLYGVNWVNTLRPRQNGRHFPDNTFKRIFLNGNVRIWIKISLKFVPKGPINNIPAMVQIMAWRRPGDKPLSEPMVVSLPTHICVARPQWVKESCSSLMISGCPRQVVQAWVWWPHPSLNGKRCHGVIIGVFVPNGDIAWNRHW